MKSFRILTPLVALGFILVFSGCGSKSTPAESTQDKQLGLLSHTWKLSSVTLGSVDQNTTGAWTNFQLTISGTKGATSFAYACAGRPTISPWPANGTWAFPTTSNADPVTQIIRDPGAVGSATAGAELPMTYTVTATTLQINFSYTGNGYSRVSNVSGSWQFNFTN